LFVFDIGLSLLAGLGGLVFATIVLIAILDNKGFLSIKLYDARNEK
jgi:hypothetical protein